MFVLFANVYQLPDTQGCATMRLSSSASRTVAVSHLPGSVMAIRIVRMALMNTTPVHLAPARPRFSAATTETACFVIGCVMGTMTAGT